METIYISGAIFIAYLIGSIPTSVWVGKLFYKVDIRNEGSGNAGATNTIRVLGLKAGIPVLIFDIFKGWFSVFIAIFVPLTGSDFPDLIDLRIMMSIAAVVGHIFPIYVGFRGGKGIATLFGVGIALFPWSALIVFGIFMFVFTIGGYVSLASVTACVSFPIVEIFILGHQQYPSLIILSILVAIFVPLTHKKNIGRLLKGKEKKFRIGKH
ncbi:MAG: glycerol-3-phosphate 1-O-acyltransferase PlsY [Bacteroidales bacterium]|nr:glycerol-3-phosphate 1-O-acyltransferase PlsY [Bacteroidales bacterium]